MPKYKCDKCGTEYKTPYCPNCGDKRTKKDEEMMTDSEILVDVINDATKTVIKKTKKLTKHNIITVLLFIVSIVFFFVGMYYKTAKQSDIDYLVHSIYFNGYMILSGVFFLSTILYSVLDKNNKK